MAQFQIRTVEDFKEHIQIGSTQESSFLDFKAMVDFKGKKDRQTLAQDFAIDLCAFANTLGGTILIGIGERQNENGIKVANGICPIENPDEIKVFFNNDVRGLIHPGVSFEIRILKIPKIILSVNVFPSIHLTSTCLHKDRNSFCFPYRTEVGNRFYLFHEIEELMNNVNSRAMYLKLLSHLKEHQSADVTLYPKPLVKNVNGVKISIINDNAEAFELTINTRVIRLPYSLIDEIWNKSDVGTSLCLKLKERIIERGKAGALDLDHPMDRHENETTQKNAYLVTKPIKISFPH